MSEEVAQLKRLFDLLEEHLDAPTALIQVRDAARRPLQVVGDKGHYGTLPINLDNGHDTPEKTVGIVPTTLLALENDQVVPQDVAYRFAKQAFATTDLHVVLRTRNPEHTPRP